MKYLSWVLYPLVLGYGIYSLIYEPHKSWYSWLLNSLVGAVYTFGFILMCPQARPPAYPPTAAGDCAWQHHAAHACLSGHGNPKTSNHRRVC